MKSVLFHRCQIASYDCLQVNFGQLHMNTLKRYRKHYDLEPQRNLSKMELVEVGLIMCSLTTNHVGIIKFEQLLFIFESFLLRFIMSLLHTFTHSSSPQIVTEHFRQQEVDEMDTVILFTLVRRYGGQA